MYENTIRRRDFNINDFLYLSGKIFDSSPYAVLVTEVSGSNLDLKEIYANSRFYDLFKTDNNNCTSHNCLNILKENLPDNDFRKLEQILLSNTHEKKGFTLDLHRKAHNPDKYKSETTKLYIEVHSTGSFNSESSYSFIFIIDLNKKGRSEYPEHNETLSSPILDNLPVALFVISKNNELLYFNNEACRVFGFNDNNYIKNISYHVNKVLITQIETMKKKLLELDHFTTEIHVWDDELNRELCLESKWIKELIDGETVYISSNTDVTEIRNLKKQVLKDQRHQSLGLLAGGIAHDLNNLLTPVKLAADFLCMNENHNNDNDHLDIISKASERASNLVNKILLFSGSGYTEKIATDIRDLMSDLIKIIEKTFPKNIKINYNIPSVLSSIESDPVQIQQVLLNICLNAKDAMPHGGILDIRINEIDPSRELCDVEFHEKKERYICISVEDTGCGIPEQDRSRLYEPFFTTKKNGNGLGLATARDIIKEHNGYINFYSKEDVGTKFSIYLPVVTSGKDRSIAGYNDNYGELQSLSMFLGNGELVLLVDDESSILRSLQLLLEKYNYNVITASDGAEAIEKYFLNRGSIKLVILDIILPCMDGLNVTRALKKYDGKLKIIGTSGFDNHDTVKIAMKEIDRFLKKPYGTTELLGNIKKLLN